MDDSQSPRARSQADKASVSNPNRADVYSSSVPERRLLLIAQYRLADRQAASHTLRYLCLRVYTLSLLLFINKGNFGESCLTGSREYLSHCVILALFIRP